MRGALTVCTCAASLAAAMVLASSASSALAAAFPGAEGCGADASGGRGGRVIKVTTLADDGPGSLRAAIDATGPRTIVFDVAGHIDLAAPLVIRHGDVTIAGQTSPGGVTLRRYGLVIDADNVVVRFLRTRPGPEAGAEVDALSVAGGQRIMIDHVSASWSVDEALSVSQDRSPDHPFLDKVTVQWSIISEALNNSVHTKGPHGYGSLIRGHSGACFSFHHNLWAHHRARMPRPGNFVAVTEDPVGPQFQFWNNVFYNWGGGHSGYNADTGALSRYDFLENWYQQGPDSTKPVAFEEECALCRSHFSGNAMDGDAPADQTRLLRCQAPACNFALAPVTDYRPETRPAREALPLVLARAGASRDRDAIDARIAREVERREGSIIDRPEERGGWTDVSARPPAPDADNDGMPDAWERRRGLDPSDADDTAGDDDDDGYRNLEEYLNEIAEAGG